MGIASKSRVSCAPSTHEWRQPGGELASVTTSVSGTALYGEVVDTTAMPRDALGRIVQKTETRSASTQSFTYTYDLQGRLTNVMQGNSVVEHFEYDLNGNRLIGTMDGTTSNGTYDDQDRLLSYGSLSYTYTPNGELFTKQDSETGEVTTYHYDALGNLLSVDLPDGRLVEYVIDGRNRRIGKKIDGVLTKAWLYKDQLKPIAELDGQGNLVARFIYASKSNVPDVVMKYNGSAVTTYRVISDHLGSPVMAVNVDNNADVPFAAEYTAFGVRTVSTGAASEDWMPFGFAGGLYDADTGLTRFGARDYDAQVGRWVSKDSILFDGGQANLYVYVGNDPVNRRDPSGLADWFLGVEVDLIGITGLEGAFGIVYDSDHPLESGIFGQAGPGSGANVGASICGGYVARDIEGWGTDIDINAGKLSPTFLFDEHGLNGMSLGYGPGIGVSFGATYGSTLTIADVIGWFTGGP